MEPDAKAGYGLVLTGVGINPQLKSERSRVDCKRVNVGDVMPLLLLIVFGLALSTGAAMVTFVMRLVKHKRRTSATAGWKLPDSLETSGSSCWVRRPTSWLAIKSGKPLAVQSALGLHNPKPCCWNDGLEQSLFIAPPVQGWILVLGSGLPDPTEDIDACYRFLLKLSQKLGQVQFFHASPVLYHHAWVKADRGRVVRAYAWAGRTLWNQGLPSPAETDLDLKCLQYAESLDQITFGQSETLAMNVEKVPLLAARWSIDPGVIGQTSLRQEIGIAGELSGRY